MTISLAITAPEIFIYSQSFGDQLGFQVKEIPEHLLHQIGVSSTKIRQAISHSHIETANQFLGYPYFFGGRVVMGNQLGKNHWLSNCQHSFIRS